MAEEPTTPDLVGLVQRFVDAANALDFDAAISLFAPDAVYDMPETLGTLEGRAAIRGFAEDWLGAYEELEAEAEEIRDLGNGVTFTVLVQRGRPRGSEGRVQFRYASVDTWVDGLIERSTQYPDIDAGRAAAERLAKERADA